MPTVSEQTVDINSLWDQYKSSGNANARTRLIEHYAWLAKVGAERMHVPATAMFSPEDLYGYAVIGLIDAIEKFDPSKGRPFEVYASLRIKGAVADALRAADWLPRGLRQGETRLRETMARLEMIHGRSPTDEELCSELGITQPELDELYEALNLSGIQSLDEILQEINDLKFSSGIADNHATNPIHSAEQSQVRDLLAERIEELPENEKLVIALYYYEDMTLKEIGRVLGVTESRACQLHTKAILKLQTKLACYLDVLFMAA